LSKKAITFVELLIVITIIAILFSITIVRLKPTFDNLELENFAKVLYYLTRYLQASSIRNAEIYYLKIDKEQGILQAFLKNKEEFQNIEGRFGKIYRVPSQVIISTEPSQAPGIYFYPDGSINKITITFENQNKKKVSLNIKGVAGEITIQ